MNTVALLVIGNEILNGDVLDTNSKYFCETLYKLGYKVNQITVIPDDAELISTFVQQLSLKYKYLFTSGGIGPTHDDLTYEGIAKAFNNKLIEHAGLKDLLHKLIEKKDGKNDFHSGHIKLTMIPESATLLFGNNCILDKYAPYPVVQIHNVIALPGVPLLFRRALKILQETILKDLKPSRNSINLYVTLEELTITDCLNRAIERLTTEDEKSEYIEVGSYPTSSDSFFKVRINVQVEKAATLIRAHRIFLEEMPQGSLVVHDPEPSINIAHKVYQLVDESAASFSLLLKQSLATIELALHEYEPHELCIGFNGGKDCTVLLHLVVAANKRRLEKLRQQLSSPEEESLSALYIRTPHAFSEVDQFVDECAERYGLQILRFNGNMKPCLMEMKMARPEIKAVFMGSRRTDPYCDHLTPMIMSDPDWPSYMRINPLLDWTYHDVWYFLQRLSVPYCSLYDRGFTSLGSMNNTKPNEKLRYVNDEGVVSYHPAFQLAEEECERNGRDVLT